MEVLNRVLVSDMEVLADGVVQRVICCTQVKHLQQPHQWCLVVVPPLEHPEHYPHLFHGKKVAVEGVALNRIEYMLSVRGV